MKHKKMLTLVLSAVIILMSCMPSFAFSKTLKIKMSSPEVATLQEQLKATGYLDKSVKTTSYFGTVTKDAVIRFQKANKLTADGIVGSKTAEVLLKQVNALKVAVTGDAPAVSRGTESNALMPNWFDEGRYIFTTGMSAMVYDVETGKRFQIVYSMSSRYHADCETASAADTKVMLELWGSFNYRTRAIILTFNGRSVAASMAGKPHCGLDALPYLAKLTNGDAYGDYVGRENCDKIKGNLMDGHFDVHFYKSLNHYNGLESADHQASVLKAFEWAKIHMPDGKLPTDVATPLPATEPQPVESPTSTPSPSPIVDGQDGVLPSASPTPAPTPGPPDPGT